MDNTPLPTTQFEQIEQQVSIGLPPSGPRIISEGPIPTRKDFVINALLVVGILFVMILSVVLLITRKPAAKKIQVSMSPAEQAVITLRSEYNNPFDASTQYSNPFSKSTNPFSDISQ